MKLCRLSASNYELLFGSPENKKFPNAVIIAQKPWCDEFLVLANIVYDGLEEVQNIPSGFDFTYCQDWGIEVTQDVIDRAVSNTSDDATLDEATCQWIVPSIGADSV